MNFSQKIIEAINNKPKNYWNFRIWKKTDLEKNIKYPAKMVSNMQLELLKIIIDNGFKTESIMDPFMGSGSILDTARYLGIKKIIGNDLNPYAFLVNTIKYNYKTIKSQSVSEDIINFEKLIANNLEIEVFNFNKINKWYTAEVINELSKIRYIIYNNNFNYPLILELCLMNVALDFSNTRKTTSKLHIKKNDDILRIDSNKIKFEFLKWYKNISLSLKKEINLGLMNSEILIYNENIFNLKLNEKVDIVMTSPPYGDNKTTISYGQFSVLPLMWVRDFSKTDYEKSFSKIDTDSLGGSLKNSKIKLEFLLDHSNAFKKLYSSFSTDNFSIFTKVIAFLYDYYQALIKIDLLLKNNGLLVLTLGNRRVAGIEIPLDLITIDFLKRYNLIHNFKRNIPYKTIPNIIINSFTKKKIKSISKETILIFSKTQIIE